MNLNERSVPNLILIQDCPPRTGFDPSTFDERHRARNSRMDEWRARNAEMNEEIREMEKQAEKELKVKADRDPEKEIHDKEQDIKLDKEELKVKAERDLEEDIKQKEQDIEMDKGRSTRNITVSKTSFAY